MSKRELTYIPLEDLIPWKDNPRGTVTAKDVAELVESISANGVKVPLIVRKIATGRYEVIAGNRRLAALIEIKKSVGVKTGTPGELKDIPCFVERLDDEEAREVAILENMQRENLAPIQEAEAFADIIQRITKSHPKEDPIAWVAFKTGKGKRFIKERLVLLDLPKEGREALRDGKMTLQAAIVLARIPSAAERKEAIELVLENNYEGQVVGEDQAKEVVRDRFELALSSAPWKWEDPFKDAPKENQHPCTGCQFNTASQNELFADLRTGKPRCLNGACFRAKAATWGKRKIAEAKDKGIQVIDGELGRRICRGESVPACSWIPKDQTQYDDRNNRTANEILKAAKIETKTALAVDPEGIVRELVPKEDVHAAIRKLNPSEKHVGQSTETKERKKMEHFRRAAVAAVAAARLKGAAMPPAVLLGAMATALVKRVSNDGQRTLGKAIGIQDVPTTNGFKDWEHAILVKMRDMKPEQLVGMSAAAFLAYDLAYFENPDASAIMRILGVDWARCKAETTEEKFKAAKEAAKKASKETVDSRKLPAPLKRIAKAASRSKKGGSKKK